MSDEISNQIIVTDDDNIRHIVNEQVTTSAIQMLIVENDPTISSTIFPQFSIGSSNDNLQITPTGFQFTGNNKKNIGGGLSILGNDLLFNDNKVNAAGGLVSLNSSGLIDSNLITFKDSEDYINLLNEIVQLKNDIDFLKNSNILNEFEEISEFSLSANHYYKVKNPINGDITYPLDQEVPLDNLFDNSICIFKTGNNFKSFNLNTSDNYDNFIPFTEMKKNTQYVLAVYDRIILWDELKTFSGFGIISTILNAVSKRRNYDFYKNPLTFELDPMNSEYEQVKLCIYGNPDIGGLEYRISSAIKETSWTPFKRYQNDNDWFKCEKDSDNTSQFTLIQFRNKNSLLSLNETNYVNFQTNRKWCHNKRKRSILIK